jgi:hypothetical protein
MAASQPDQAEYRKAFAEMVSDARTYLVRCVVILVLLTVVVEDRLAGLRRDIARVEGKIKEVDRALWTAADQVGRQLGPLVFEYRALEQMKCPTPNVDLTFIENLPTTPGEFDAGELAAADKAATALLEHARPARKDRVLACPPTQETDGRGAKVRQTILSTPSPRRTPAAQMEIVASLLRAYVREYRRQTRVWNDHNLD